MCSCFPWCSLIIRFETSKIKHNYSISNLFHDWIHRGGIIFYNFHGHVYAPKIWVKKSRCSSSHCVWFCFTGNSDFCFSFTALFFSKLSFVFLLHGSSTCHGINCIIYGSVCPPLIVIEPVGFLDGIFHGLWLLVLRYACCFLWGTFPFILVYLVEFLFRFFNFFKIY